MAQYEAGEWPVDYSLSECGPFDEASASTLQGVSELAAVNLLWNWTNHMFGSTEVTLRPQLRKIKKRPSTFEGRGPFQQYPFGGSQSRLVRINGHLHNLRCGCGVIQCDCSPGRQYALALPGKAQTVSEVQIDETVLDVSSYRLQDDAVLLAEGYWPTYQNMRLELGSVGTWGITYIQGLPVPAGGELAAGVLACELGKALVKDPTCRLPVRLQLLVNNGASESIKDTYGAYLSFGKTGLWIIDSWVDSVLVNREYSSVRSVDLPGMR